MKKLTKIQKESLTNYHKLLDQMDRQELINAMLDDAEEFFLDVIVAKYGGQK